MRCLNCGNIYDEISDSLKLHNHKIGHYEVDNVKYAQCPGCGKILYPEETVLKIEEIENYTKNQTTGRIIDSFWNNVTSTPGKYIDARNLPN